MRRIIWASKARNDFREILAFVAERDVPASRLVRGRIREAIVRLSQIPIGRPARVDGYFEKSVTGAPYTIAYSLTDKTLSIIRIIHQRRDWPDDDWPQG